MKRVSLLKIVFVAVALFSSISAWAQVSFTVDAPALTALGQPFRVEFTVDAEPEDNTLQAPDFAGFELIAGPSVSTGHSVQFINGRQTSSYSRSFTYVLIPQSVGTFTIGSASIEVDGKRYSTRPTPIEVIDEGQSSAKSSGSAGGAKQQSTESRLAKDDILIRLKVSDREVYKGESIRASLVLYTRVGVDIESLEMPSFDDFWTQELSFENSPSREEYNGKVYETYKINELLLSPQRSGEIAIQPAKMQVLAQVVVQNGRGFDPIFGGRQVYHVTRDLKTEPIIVKVKAFPADAPASFNGAVGNFTMRCTMPEAQIEANSADQISVTISGEGNLKFITAPKLQLPESFELYDIKVTDNIKVTAAGTSGSITYTYPFVARSAGSFTIEPLEFSYLDPRTGSYHTVASERFSIEVSDDGSIASASSAVGFTDYGGAMRQLDRDIRFIHTEGKPQPAVSMLILSPIYWLVIVALLSAFITIYVVMRRRIALNRNVVARRMKHADKYAVQRLRLAERYMREDNRHAFYEEMLRAMWGYISDKFNIPVSGLTKETIREELYRRGVSAADAEQFCEIISRADEAQYAPSTDGDMNSIYGDAVEVISKIESVVKR